eukprot:GILJ01010209.1.p1 GENE.GILJ01010209.1~~GILJ01010209.1.p1  ORF type:complete len:1421 (-),score=210.50 GILJ01010209.1:229-4491(-)
MVVKYSRVGEEENLAQDASKLAPKEALEEAFPQGFAPCPELSLPWYRKMTFSWVKPLLAAGYVKPVTSDNLWDLHSELKGECISKEMISFWERHQHRHRALWIVIFKTFSSEIRRSFCLRLFTLLFALVTPLLLKLLLSYVQQAESGSLWVGLGLALLLLIDTSVQAVTIHWFYWCGLKMGMRARAGLITLVHRKCLSISSASKQATSVGAVVNLASVDADNLLYFIWDKLAELWASPVHIIVVLAMLFWFLGVSAIPGVSLMVLSVPLHAAISRQDALNQTASMESCDRRIRLMSELLLAIKLVKLYAWEQFFDAQIAEARRRELLSLKRSAHLAAWSRLLSSVTPLLVSLASFGTFVSLGNSLDPVTAFTCLSLFNSLKTPLLSLPYALKSFVCCLVSVNRIERFLKSEDKDEYVIPSDVKQIPLSVDVGGDKHGSIGERTKQSNTTCDSGVIRMANSSAASGADKRFSADALNLRCEIRNGYFLWSSEGCGTVSDDMLLSATLQDVNVCFPPGKLTCVVGKVGSGKSSLLLALLGEIRKLQGAVTTPLNVAFTSQQAWLRNESARDNILFCRPFEKARYELAVRSCCLEQDFAAWSQKDDTEIGEQGVSLSGGQKQRLALARAVYANADCYLLDEPLAAVDAHVGKLLFHECITNALSGSTRIMVTHQLQFIPQADYIVVCEEGRIAHQGTYEQLKSKVDFTTIVKQKAEELNIEPSHHKPLNDAATYPVHVDSLRSPVQSSDHVGEIQVVRKISFNQESSDELDGDPIHVKAELPLNQDRTHFRAWTNDSVTSPGRPLVPRIRPSQVTEEPAADLFETSAKETQSKGPVWAYVNENPTGAVGNEVYRAYYAASGGLKGMALVIAAFLGCQLVVTGSDYWLVFWSNSSKDADHRDSFYIRGYAFWLVALGVLVIYRSVVSATATLRASVTIHQRLFNGILYAPQHFFDTTPSGRILNRCSKDQEIIDKHLPEVIQDVLFCGITTLGAVAVVMVVAPLAVPLLLVIGYIYFRVQAYYRPTSRELKRIEASLRAPIYSHVSATLMGLQIVRAFGHRQVFFQQCIEKLNANTRMYIYAFAVNRWLGVRLEMIGNLVIFTAAVFAVLMKDSVGTGFAGLVLSSVLSLSGNLNWFVRQLSEMEVQMNAVERVLQYCQLPSEGQRVNRSLNLPANWPQEGRVQFNNLVIRYREDMPPVLHGVTCSIQSREKVGVVGRTGAGKSTFALALFRIVEPTSGSIEIDGVNISSMGLADLRSRLSIIPQDPVLFTGSIRSNLDPFEQFTDSEIWSALVRVHLQPLVEQLPLKLHARVEENGDNFSVGQRQLLCVCRAVLKRSVILVMDEATAALDFHTDQLIKELIRKEFSRCTVITIAHRLDTIVDSDRVMVFDKGRLAEFDRPAVLMRQPHSLFAKLTADAKHLAD